MQDSDSTLRFIDPEASSGEDFAGPGGDLSSGFPSPAEHFTDAPLDLTRRSLRNPAATFSARLHGHAPRHPGIRPGAPLPTPKSLGSFRGRPAVCFLDGEFRLKRLEIRAGQIRLHPSDTGQKGAEIYSEGEIVIWGVVIASIRKHL